jgi:hypothetical protein
MIPDRSGRRKETAMKSPGDSEVFPTCAKKVEECTQADVPGEWGLRPIYRTIRGWLFPYVRSRVLPGDFHPITSYLFVEYKCNLDCW